LYCQADPVRCKGLALNINDDDDDDDDDDDARTNNFAEPSGPKIA